MESSSHIVALVCTACGKRFANRWAYNQHRTNRHLVGTDCYTLQGQQAELVASKRGNVSTAVLRSAGPSRAGTQKNNIYFCIYMYMHVMCSICMDLNFEFYIFYIFCIYLKNMQSPCPSPHGGGPREMGSFAYFIFIRKKC